MGQGLAVAGPDFFRLGQVKHGTEPRAGERDHPSQQHVAKNPDNGFLPVREIVRDLVGRGYEGGMSIEPHLAAVVHLAKEASDPEAAYRMYVEYGRRLMQLVDEERAKG